MINKSRVRLSPRLIAQTSPNPSLQPQKFFKIGGMFFLIAAAILLVRTFAVQPNGTPDLPNTESVLGAEDVETGPVNYYIYTVSPGDTLFSVSQKFQVNWEAIVDLNGLREPFALAAGQHLRLPQSPATRQQQFYDNLKKKIYLVEDGDNFVSIAQKLNISVTDLLRANPELTTPDQLRVGQILRLP